MEPDPQPLTVSSNPKSNVWTTVTPLSKYLALGLFIVLPFVGGWLGYQCATGDFSGHTQPEVDRQPYEPILKSDAGPPTDAKSRGDAITDGDYVQGRYWKTYSVPWTDFTIPHPAGWLVDEEGTWSGVMYAFLDYVWPKEMPVEEYLNFSHEMYSGELSDVLDAYYKDPTHSEARNAFEQEHSRDRTNGIEGVTLYYVYKTQGMDALQALGEDMPIVVHETKKLGGRVWEVGTVKDDLNILFSEFDEVFVFFLTDAGYPQRLTIMNVMAEHIQGNGILSEDHPGCCY